MLVKCYTCGEYLADKWAWFFAKLEAHSRISGNPDIIEFYNRSPDDPSPAPETESARCLKYLKLTNTCCCRSMITVYRDK